MIGVLVIGDEVISGRVQDSNGAYLAKKLGEYGAPLKKILIIGDHEIEKGLSQLFDTCNMVFTTGGLGPTHDDITVEKIAHFFQLELTYSRALDKQIYIPKEEEKIPNPVGSALGLILKKEGKCIIALPGVPVEMRAMTDQLVKSLFVKEKNQKRIFSLGVNYCHTKEDQLAKLLAKIEKENPEFRIGIYPGSSVLQVVLRGEGTSEEEFGKRALPILSLLEKTVPTCNFPWHEGKIVLALHEELKKRKEKIIFAESCTGGDLAATVTQNPGASHYFLGSFVVYEDAMKEKVLHVKKKTLLEFGAVSAQVVQEMTEGLFNLSDATWAIAVSGIAGPDGGTPEKPVGTIWASVSKKGEKPDIGLIPLIRTLPRKEMIERTTNFLIGALWRKLTHNIRIFHDTE